MLPSFQHPNIKFISKAEEKSTLIFRAINPNLASYFKKN